MYPILVSETTSILKHMTEEQIYAEMNTLPAREWSFRVKMKKLTPPFNANSCKF